MTDQTVDTSQTDTGVENTGDNVISQDSDSKTFTQDELNAIVAKRVSQAQKKFANVDVEEYRALKTEKQEAETAGMLKREEFDKVLKQTKEKSDLALNKIKAELTKVQVDGALVNAASKRKATNPEHVAQLLRGTVQLDDNGLPVVLNKDGEVRYNTDAGEPFTIDNLVDEFINANPYFKAPGKAGTSSASNTQSTVGQEADLSKLDLNRPEDRKIYEKMIKDGKI